MAGTSQTTDGTGRQRGGPRKSPAAFRTISEVAGELDVAQHVLRFWESKFPQVRPLKRGGGRRYYRPEDIELLRQIRALLYEEGYTIKGAQKLLKGGKRQVVVERGNDNGAAAQSIDPPDGSGLPPETRARLSHLRDDLARMRAALREARG